MEKLLLHDALMPVSGNKTMPTLYCQKLKHQAEALPEAPYPGKMGEKIFANISKPAWDMWLAHQTMLINEYRLSMADPKARAFLNKEMHKFLFDEEI